MKVLWITNILLPEAEREITHNEQLKGSGGWMVSLLAALSKHKNIEIIIASVHKLVKEIKEIQGVHAKYYVIPYGHGNISYNKQYEEYWKMINEKEHPDIVHLHGTEFSHGLAWLKVFGSDNMVISIQGLVHVIEKYVFYGVPKWDYIRNWQPTSLLINEKRNLKKRAVCEIDYLRIGKYFIGRTEWDKSHISAINPQAHYYYCGEMLRESFYSSQWVIGDIERHSLFVSQANTSIKGLHQVIKALPLILREYPDTILYVGGARYFTSPESIRKKLIKSTWFSYIGRLIKEHKVENSVVFLPPLDEQDMLNRFLKSHVFVLPSSIENSSNSLAEAQILGVPSIASYVGGTPSMIDDGNTGLLYRFEEYEMLAKKINDVFGDDRLAESLSIKEREQARDRHNREVIVKNMLEIYNSIRQDNK